MEYQVEFYFTSGETMLVTYSKERLDEMQGKLKQAWHTCCIVSEEWGLNFAQVTHYRVNKIT